MTPYQVDVLSTMHVVANGGKDAGAGQQAAAPAPSDVGTITDLQMLQGMVRV